MMAHDGEQPGDDREAEEDGMPGVEEPRRDTGSATAAASEATETILQTAKNATQTRMTTPNEAGSSAARTPAEVATPLPPLKPSQGVKLWPRIAARAAATKTISESEKRARITTGRNPFRKSSRNASEPHPFPKTRQTLVAPMFPLPRFRRSTLFHFPIR